MYPNRLTLLSIFWLSLHRWFVNLSTTGGFTSWFVMNITYIFFRTSFLAMIHWCHMYNLCLFFLGRGMLAQGYDLTKNSYHNRWQPYISYWGAGWTLFFIFVNGFAVFWNFNAADFLTACECLRSKASFLYHVSYSWTLANHRHQHSHLCRPIRWL